MADRRHEVLLLAGQPELADTEPVERKETQQQYRDQHHAGPAREHRARPRLQPVKCKRELQVAERRGQPGQVERVVQRTLRRRASDFRAAPGHR